MTDEELQGKIENGEPVETSDAEAYRMLFNTLKREPEFELSSNFASNVVRLAGKKSLALDSERDQWWLIAGIVIFISAGIFAAFAASFKPGVGAFTFISGHWGLIIFGILFVALLNVFDRKLRRKIQH